MSVIHRLRLVIDDLERRQVARAPGAGAHRGFGDPFPASSPRHRLRSSPQTRLAVEYARREAETLGAATVGSEHLLLGLLRSGDHPAVEALRELGVDFDAARQVCACRGEARAGEPKAVLAAAARAVRTTGADRVGVEHLLIGVLSDPAGGAADVVRTLGVTPEAAAGAAAPSPSRRPPRG